MRTNMALLLMGLGLLVAIGTLAGYLAILFFSG